MTNPTPPKVQAPPPPECTQDNCHNCPNMKSIQSDWDSERYSCEKCGLTYKLYEEEMK